MRKHKDGSGTKPYVHVYFCSRPTDRCSNTAVHMHVRIDTSADAHTHINTTLFTSNPDGICTEPVLWAGNKMIGKIVSCRHGNPTVHNLFFFSHFNQNEMMSQNCTFRDPESTNNTSKFVGPEVTYTPCRIKCTIEIQLFNPPGNFSFFNYSDLLSCIQPKLLSSFFHFDLNMAFMEEVAGPFHCEYQ